MTSGLLNSINFSLLEHHGTERARAELFVLFREQTLDLGTAVIANTPSFHSSVEQTLALAAAHGYENVTRQTLTHVTAEVKVLEKEGVGLIELLAVTDVVHFGLFADDNFEVHYFASIHVFHLKGKHAFLLVYLFETT